MDEAVATGAFEPDGNDPTAESTVVVATGPAENDSPIADAVQDAGAVQDTNAMPSGAAQEAASAPGHTAPDQPAAAPQLDAQHPQAAGIPPATGIPPAAGTPPAEPGPSAPPKPKRLLSRRQAIFTVTGASALMAEAAFLDHRATAAPALTAQLPPSGSYARGRSGYAPDGTAGATAAFPLSHVRLLDSPFKDNQARNTDYLLFLDPDRMLHTFRLNYGIPSSAEPCGGWERPASEVRGHMTGHLLSGLAITYANTGDPRARQTAEYLVGQLAALQSRAVRAGYHQGYLSAFPEYFFDWLESRRPVWSPYYMIHKYLAGLIDTYQLIGVQQALDVAIALADWVDWRTGRLTYAHMQVILQVEHGGIQEALANLYAITGNQRYLRVAGRFYHAMFFDPLAMGVDNLAGLHANTNTPKVISAVRMWEETGNTAYRDIARFFWRDVTEHYSYIIGGSSNHEHWILPDVVASQLSNYTCEGCVTYNMLKLTRLLHFHQPRDTAMLDYYERALFNHILGQQDPTSAHGFDCYYLGMSPGAFKQQPLNYFPGADPNIYATDWDTFTCDTATGLENQAKFADTIYSRDGRGVNVNLFIPSEVRCADQGITLRQTTRFPDEPGTTLTVTSGSAAMELRVRVPGWAAGPPTIRLNGQRLAGVVHGGWITVNRFWKPNDRLEAVFPMRVTFNKAPDNPTVQAVTYGPVVLAGAYGTDARTAMPVLEPGSVSKAWDPNLTFEATADGVPVTLLPVARVNHEHFNVYWRTV